MKPTDTFMKGAATSYCCPACGQRIGSVPRCDFETIEITTYVSHDDACYLARAHLDKGPPVIVRPFEVSEIRSFGRQAGYRWRVRPRTCTLFSPSPLRNFSEAESYLKQWVTQLLRIR